MHQSTLFSFVLSSSKKRSREDDVEKRTLSPTSSVTLTSVSTSSSLTEGLEKDLKNTHEVDHSVSVCHLQETFSSGENARASFSSVDASSIALSVTVDDQEKELMEILQSVEIPAVLSVAHLFCEELKDSKLSFPKKFGKLWETHPASSQSTTPTSICESKGEKAVVNSVNQPSSDAVPYAVVVDVLSDISATSSRLECVKYLTLLLLTVVSRCPEDIIPVLYLVLNKQAPAHEGIELGVGDSFLIKAVADACGMTEVRVKELYKQTGDLAEVAQENKQKQMTLLQPLPLLAREVHQTFCNIAVMQGKDVMRRRLNIIKRLLTAAKGPEVNFIVRALQQKMRIGLAESSVLTAMGYAFALYSLGVERASKLSTEQLQAALMLGASGLTRAYAEVPSLEILIPAVMRHGWMILIPTSRVYCSSSRELSIRPGLPVRPQLASPSNGVKMVLHRFQGKRFTSEYKYDGERAQIHYDESKRFHIFSRNSERQTGKYPDVIAMLPEAFDPNHTTSFIIDSEVVAIHPESGALQAFQVLQHRGRKNIQEENIQVRVCVFAFDILYFNGQPTLNLSLAERRKLLHSAISPIAGKLAFATSMDSDSVEDIEKFLEQSITDGCEGLMLKSLYEGAQYTPGKRSFSWLKLKKDYMDGITDTLDLVPIGVYFGKGKRTGVFGGFLMACYDAENDEYQSICKIGTGLKDDVLEEVTKELQPLIEEEKPKYYRAEDVPDRWLRESVVWEVKAADLSISPVHAAALGLIDATRGIALRFPRYLRTREDKRPSDATTSQQVAQMYRTQSLAVQQCAALEQEEDE